jgi:hypothetical protein
MRTGRDGLSEFCKEEGYATSLVTNSINTRCLRIYQFAGLFVFQLDTGNPVFFSDTV